MIRRALLGSVGCVGLVSNLELLTTEQRTDLDPGGRRYLAGARLLEAVVKSALGNAEDRGARNIDDLVVTESRVDGGPMLKRIMPRARGTAYPIKRRYSHIHITLSDLEELAGEE